jgi:prepilin-type processing-associated H-X9-DG protein
MKRVAKILLLSLVGFFFFLCLIPHSVPPIELVTNLAVGWFIFMNSVAPKVTVNWGGVALGTIALALFSGGLHAFLFWLYDRVRQTANDGVFRIDTGWKPRWTAAVVEIVLLIFVAGIAATGMTHQLGWLLASEDPWLSQGGARRAARRAQSVNNLKQIGLGLEIYHSGFGSFPPGATAGEYGQLLQSWQTALLPYLEHGPLYAEIDQRLPWDDPRNASVFRNKVWTFLNPAVELQQDANGYALSHYAANAHVLGGLGHIRQDAITDGISTTILAGEAAGDYSPWGRPGNWRDPARGINQSPDGFGSPFRGGANILFADGSVRFIKDSVNPKILAALGTPDGGEDVSPNDY